MSTTKPMMRALGVRKWGKSDKLEELDVPVPSIVDSKDILVLVKAVGLNQADAVKALGLGRLVETVSLPFIIGFDYAGIVSAVGGSVIDFSPGDAVYGFKMGGTGAAEYLLLSSSCKYSIAKIPGKLSFEGSASLPVATHTALRAIDKVNNEMPGGLKGKTVLVTAGLGGIGSMALQLLKPVFGAAKVITTLSTGKIPLLSGLLGEGLVDQIIDYTSQDVVAEAGPGSVDFVLDTVFSSMAYLALLKPGTGVVLSVMGKSGTTLAEDYPRAPWVLRKLMDILDGTYKWRASRRGVRYEHANTQFSKEDSERIDGWVREGKLKPIVGEVFGMGDLDRVRKALDLVATGKGAVGKYVVKMS
ncbi:Reticulon-4-interacting protein, mitochondrial [Lachnellula willkommii]|uniref:Reticulon-4-interacting protein, mitochondrial n=1 Tax=Lachnellula willkommii TaxID=215461 RepID=A0A559MJ67_9HELO|nr:Reticulon-4-interacting protein, mitochondrial [Lachnellula willkommii]